MKSPFKLLDAYTLKDENIFFGREKEVNTLYKMVFASPLSMVYGLSGTGKTSLIQCGLASKFDGPDWFPFFIRKGENINSSLKKALKKITQKDLPLVESVSHIYRHHLRPVYLIFDQFEELFILGSAQEQANFINNIKTLIDSKLPIKTILVIREEYLGALYHFEQVIPFLFDFRLRVEPMNTANVKKMMGDSFKKFNISLAGNKEERLQALVDNISAGKSGIQLPYLQVYLDMLYRRDYHRTYPHQQPKEKYPLLEFTQSEIEQLGQFDDVLEQFLLEQQKELQQELQIKYENFPSETIGLVLDAFVTDEGTKRPVSITRIAHTLIVAPSFKALIPKLSDAIISDCLNQLEKRRILRFTDSAVELAHDSIALVIDKKRTAKQRTRNEISKRINNNYREHLQTGEFLSKNQITLYEAFLPSLNLTPSILNFVEKSRIDIKLKEEEKVLQKQQEVALKEETQKAGFRQKLLQVSGVLGIIIMGLAGWALWQRAEIKKVYGELEKETMERLYSVAALAKGQGDYGEAINHLGILKNYIGSHHSLTSPLNLDSLKGEWGKIDYFVAKGDSLLEVPNSKFNKIQLLPDALNAFDAALTISNDDKIVAQKVNQVKEKMKEEYHDLLYKAQLFIDFQQCEHSKEALDLAERMNQSNYMEIDSLRAKCGHVFRD